MVSLDEYRIGRPLLTGDDGHGFGSSRGPVPRCVASVRQVLPGPARGDYGLPWEVLSMPRNALPLLRRIDLACCWVGSVVFYCIAGFLRNFIHHPIERICPIISDF